MVTGTIQVRLGSSRLPGKAMLPILGRPMLFRQIERLRAAKTIDEIIIATTTSAMDDEIASLGDSLGIKVYRGSEHDVLSRIGGLLRHHNVDVHVEMLGDSPLPDPQIVDEVVTYFLQHRHLYDFVSNDLTVTYPPGLEVKVYSAETLLACDSLVAEDDPLREHVSLHIVKRPEKFRLKNLKAPADLSFPNIYLEVDTDLDLALIREIFSALYPKNPLFSARDILDFLAARIDLAQSNTAIERRWKKFKDEI